MANTTDSKGLNQPSREAQVKGGQQSHQGGADSSRSQTQQSNDVDQKDNRTQNQPSRDAQGKGGQHSHSGGNK
jgi:hypothetical protein